MLLTYAVNMVSKATKMNLFGRRRFVAALASLGVTGQAAASLTPAELNRLTDNPEKEIPRVKYWRHTNHEAVKRGNARPEREPVFYTIPREQWLRTQTGLDGAQRVYQMLRRSSLDLSTASGGVGSPPSRYGVSIGITNRVDGTDVAVLVQRDELVDRGSETDAADYPTIDELKEVVPSRVSGRATYRSKTEVRSDIPVLFRSSRQKEQGSTDSYFGRTVRPVGAGCEAGRNVDKEKDAWTLGTPAWDDINGGAGWVTAGHTIDFEGGHTVYQNSCSSDNNIGESVRAMSDGDAGYIDSNEDTIWSVVSEDTDSEDFDWDIVGIVSDSRIQDMVATDEKARFQGRRTGRSHSEVTDYHTNGFGNGDHTTVVINHDSDGGDSGGIYYELDSDGAYMMGIHSRADTKDDTQARGNTMEYIENHLDVSV